MLLGLAALLSLPIHLGAAPPGRLSKSELAQIKCLCVQAVDTPINKLWVIPKLEPFVRDKKHFKESIIVCSGGCTFTAYLRGGLVVVFSGPNVPHGEPGYLEHPAIDTVSILRESKDRPWWYPPRRDNSAREIFTVTSDGYTGKSVLVSMDRKELLSRLAR